jgi:hypothetical protein
MPPRAGYLYGRPHRLPEGCRLRMNLTFVTRKATFSDGRGFVLGQ